MNNEAIDERLSALEKKIDALSNLIDQQTQRAPQYLNYNEGHYFKPHNIMSSYYHSGWVGGHMRISPTKVQIFKVKEAQVAIIENKSNNLLMT